MGLVPRRSCITATQTLFLCHLSVLQFPCQLIDDTKKLLFSDFLAFSPRMPPRSCFWAGILPQKCVHTGNVLSDNKLTTYAFPASPGLLHFHQQASEGRLPGIAFLPFFSTSKRQAETKFRQKIYLVSPLLCHKFGTEIASIEGRSVAGVREAWSRILPLTTNTKKKGPEL